MTCLDGLKFNTNLLFCVKIWCENIINFNHFSYIYFSYSEQWRRQNLGVEKLSLSYKYGNYCNFSQVKNNTYVILQRQQPLTI